jgi:hypothetical protein
MNEEIRLLSLWQPWASLIAVGKKQYETRHWATSYRGLVAIHAAKRKVDSISQRLFADVAPELTELPMGAIVAILRLGPCWIMSESMISRQTELERKVGNWQPGRYAWELNDVRPIAPIYTPGKQGLSVIRDHALLKQIEEGLDHATD